ncbi:MAG: HAD-IIIA family hydrolase [Candidatus Omnitrophica bacterium]|nr:HAD-IIIA family hydrolase [Candidatus Omnitrophota bacterium]
MRAAVFLDRDGVINVRPQGRYVTRAEEFEFLPGVLPALRRLTRSGQQIFVVSNQSGVGRKVMSRRALTGVTRKMLRGIERSGGKIRAVYYCTHAPRLACACRKPRTGLLLKAARRWRLDLARSSVIGDDTVDVAMGRAAGCRTVLVLSGKQTRASAKKLPVRPDKIAADLSAAVRWILQEASE